jgi:hypothetical protein
VVPRRVTEEGDRQCAFGGTLGLLVVLPCMCLGLFKGRGVGEVQCQGRGGSPQYSGWGEGLG